MDSSCKFHPSKEVEYPDQVLRFEDNFDATSNVIVTITRQEVHHYLWFPGTVPLSSGLSARKTSLLWQN
ncbi:hypothetical protein K7X08_001052 [Anisodus acutangulus]|uniref:Uncharacterized protein n=1 Tax=Anisodus acutangulus TaxID=402998 RepID=A0A9Q1RN12_9SOLA|nr:hypothetical protein K7X08_001052 [Anisodus acutangulus]